MLRHVQGLASGREQIQSLAHELDHITKPPLARATWGDALASARRTPVLHDAIAELRRLGLARLPDRLGDFAGLAKREVYAVDGSDQHESARFGRRTKAEGGEDSAKGHCLLSFYDLRAGCVVDVWVETRSRHEIAAL